MILFPLYYLWGPGKEKQREVNPKIIDVGTVYIE